jgi:hypothetical protein
MMASMITGKDLIAYGYPPGRWFAAALAEINAGAISEERIRNICDRLAPPPARPLRTVHQNQGSRLTIIRQFDLNSHLC